MKLDSFIYILKLIMIEANLKCNKNYFILKRLEIRINIYKTFINKHKFPGILNLLNLKQIFFTERCIEKMF